jgi:hypothetical protein
MKKLFDILVREGDILEQEFAKASFLGEGTSQEVAEFRENALRAFISRFYPSPYKVVKGKIHDSFGSEVSASIDCIVVNPVHPNLIDSQGKFQLILADGVDVAVEVKPDISASSELGRGLMQGISVKKLRRAKSPLLLPKGVSHQSLEESTRIPYFIIAQTAKANIHSTIKEIDNWYHVKGIPVEEQVDAIAILGAGVIYRNKYAEALLYTGLQQLPDNLKVGWFYEEWKSATLAGLLLHMEFSYHSAPTIQESIMRRYIRTFELPNVQRIEV